MAKKLTINYHVPKDYKPSYVSGAQGGFTPRGEMVIHFLLDTLSIPKKVELNVTEGKVQPIELFESEGIERTVQAGVIMELRTATELHEFLGAQLEQFSKRTKPK